MQKLNQSSNGSSSQSIPTSNQSFHPWIQHNLFISSGSNFTPPLYSTTLLFSLRPTLKCASPFQAAISNQDTMKCVSPLLAISCMHHTITYPFPSQVIFAGEDLVTKYRQCFRHTASEVDYLSNKSLPASQETPLNILLQLKACCWYSTNFKNPPRGYIVETF